MNKEWKDSKISIIKKPQEIFSCWHVIWYWSEHEFLTGDEATFYAHQLSDHNCRISMDEDLKYVNKK